MLSKCLLVLRLKLFTMTNFKDEPIVKKPTSFTTEVTTPTAAVAEAPKTAEQLRQEKQREETQAFLDQQEIARQTMAAETKAKEEREKKASQKK